MSLENVANNIHIPLHMSSKKNNGEIKQSKLFFEYFCDDPITSGKWRIISREKLTADELDRQLRFMVVFGYDRPPAGALYTFKLPKTTNSE